MAELTEDKSELHRDYARNFAPTLACLMIIVDDAIDHPEVFSGQLGNARSTYLSKILDVQVEKIANITITEHKLGTSKTSLKQMGMLTTFGLTGRTKSEVKKCPTVEALAVLENASELFEKIALIVREGHVPFWDSFPIYSRTSFPLSKSGRVRVNFAIDLSRVSEVTREIEEAIANGTSSALAEEFQRKSELLAELADRYRDLIDKTSNRKGKRDPVPSRKPKGIAETYMRHRTGAYQKGIIVEGQRLRVQTTKLPPQLLDYKRVEQQELEPCIPELVDKLPDNLAIHKSLRLLIHFTLEALSNPEILIGITPSEKFNSIAQRLFGGVTDEAVRKLNKDLPMALIGNSKTLAQEAPGTLIQVADLYTAASTAMIQRQPHPLDEVLPSPESLSTLVARRTRQEILNAMDLDSMARPAIAQHFRHLSKYLYHLSTELLCIQKIYPGLFPATGASYTRQLRTEQYKGPIPFVRER